MINEKILRIFCPIDIFKLINYNADMTHADFMQQRGDLSVNIYIMVDIEGISGVYSPEQVLPDGRRFREGREYMTADINACIAACKEAGVEKVYVRDCHGSSESVIYEKLSALADYCICGNTGDRRFPGLEDCDGVILLGYHAMAGTTGGILEHTMSSKRIQNYYINGKKAGEVAIDAAIIGDYGKPVIMVSGDDKVCREAKQLLPWIADAEVKKGITWQGGILLPQEKAHAVLIQAVKDAIARFGEMKPYVLERPIRFTVECTERSVMPSQYAKPYIKIIDGRTYEITADTMEEALFRV